MLTTLQPTTIDPMAALDLDPRDVDAPRELYVTVNVSPGATPGTYHHDVASLSAAGQTGSSWTVIWTLETNDQNLSLNFNGDGIIVPKPGRKMPEAVDDIQASKLSSTRSKLTFTNNVVDVNVIRYDLDFTVTDSGGAGLTRANFIFDPTIAVVQEPIDG